METQVDKISYIIGRQIGGDFVAQGLEINTEIFTAAVKSATLGEPGLISPEETQTIMQAFQMEMQAKQQEAAAASGAANEQAGASFLAQNKEKEGVQVTASGLQYKVIQSGTGKTPTTECSVEAHYEGTLIDGTVFDSSYRRGEPTTFPVSGVIPGWTEALQLMKEGDIFELAIPSNLAYGAQGAGPQIGPNSTLLFKIELVKVQS